MTAFETTLRRLLLTFVLLLALAPSGRADEVIFRGNYWRDRNTRVVQPEADFSKELPSGTVVGAHYLLDTITSASAAAGVTRDQPFTELRNELGVRAGQRIGPATITGSYSYSSESDYWAHLFSLSGVVDLFQKNTTLGLSASYGSDHVGMRMGPSSFQYLGGLQTFHLIASATQVLTRTLLLNLSYEIGVLGFGSSPLAIRGDPNKDTGFQANPYRTVLVAQSPVREVVPYQRVRQAVAASAHIILPTHNPLVPYLAFRPGYRLYWDDWGLVSSAPELRAYVPLGATEWRLTGRYYTQRAASFWREKDGKPTYDSSAGAPCTTCMADASRTAAGFYTADPKLSAFNSVFLEARLLFKLSAMRELTWLPLAPWFANGVVEISYGHLFEDHYAQTAYGDADLAGLSLSFPL